MKSESSFSKMQTNGLIVEHRQLHVALSVDLAQHISQRRANGRIVIVTSHPQALMSSVRKQWIKWIRKARRSRASTLDRQRQYNLDEIIYGMESISFTAKSQADKLRGYVTFATVEQLLIAPPTCATLYITEPIEKINQYLLTAWMPRDGLVVIYAE